MSLNAKYRGKKPKKYFEPKYGHCTREDNENFKRSINENISTTQLKEGNVGGGTWMISFRFKGGIGTSSRVLKFPDTTYTVGLLVQANYGDKNDSE